jgi:hypothetical protein
MKNRLEHCVNQGGCGQFEDTPHVVRCKGPGADVIFELSVQKLEIVMGDKFTAPEITAAIGKRIRQWRKHSTGQIIDQATPLPRCYRNDEFGTKAALDEQDKIGWYNFLLGRLSTKWMDAQQKCLESLGNLQPGEDGRSQSSANCGILHGICGSTATTLSIILSTPGSNWKWSSSDSKSANYARKERRNYYQGIGSYSRNPLTHHRRALETNKNNG